MVVKAVAVEKPSSAEELARKLHDAASQKLAVVPVGGGRASGMGGVPERIASARHIALCMPMKSPLEKTGSISPAVSPASAQPGPATREETSW